MFSSSSPMTPAALESELQQIEEEGSAVKVLRNERNNGQAPRRDTVLGTLVRFKQMKKWNFVGEVI